MLVVLQLSDRKSQFSKCVKRISNYLPGPLLSLPMRIVSILEKVAQ